MNEELKVVITAEIDKLKKELDNGKKSVKGFTEETKKKVKEFNDEVQKVGDVAKKALQ